MAEGHHRLDGQEFGWTPGVGNGQEGLACYSPWGCKESDMTEQLNWTIDFTDLEEILHIMASLIAQLVKNLPSMQQTPVQFSQSCLTATPWTAAHQGSLFNTNSQRLLKLMSIKSVLPFNPLFSCLQSFPSSGSFPISQFFESGGQSIGTSASILPINIQDWFLLGLTGWISLKSKGLSRVFSNTTVQKYQFFGAQLSLWSNSHIHTWLLEKP